VLTAVVVATATSAGAVDEQTAIQAPGQTRTAVGERSRMAAELRTTVSTFTY
jgi:hypothetical protein